MSLNLLYRGSLRGPLKEVRSARDFRFLEAILAANRLANWVAESKRSVERGAKVVAIHRAPEEIANKGNDTAYRNACEPRIIVDTNRVLISQRTKKAFRNTTVEADCNIKRAISNA